MTDRDPVLEDFARRETERADRNGARASEMEVTLMETRHALRATTEGLDEVARRHGWSEEVNCTPWAWLDNEIVRHQEQMTVEQLMSIVAQHDLLIVAGHVFMCRDLNVSPPCVRCGLEAMDGAVVMRETCDGPELTTERLIAALYGKDGESSDE